MSYCIKNIEKKITNNIDESAVILGELIVELKLPIVVSELINSYITPNIMFDIVLNEIVDISFILKEIMHKHPNPKDISNAVNIKKKLKYF